MAGKSLEQEIADLEAELVKKQAELDAKKREAAFQEFPKDIGGGIVVNSAEEEKAIKAAAKKDHTKDPTEAEIRAQKDAEADRAKGKK